MEGGSGHEGVGSRRGRGGLSKGGDDVEGGVEILNKIEKYFDVTHLGHKRIQQQ